MEKVQHRVLVIVIYTILKVPLTEAVMWKTMGCWTEPQTPAQEGILPNIGRFPWMGVIQHSFYIAEKTRFAITQAVLVHPGYAIAPAEDIAKIKMESIMNNTKFIVWKGPREKFAIPVVDYILHPDYLEGRTFATVAMVELEPWAEFRIGAPILPVCMPTTGAGTFSEMYALKLTDATETKDLEKEVLTMNYILDADCEEFYYRSQLTYQKMTPDYQICAAVRNHTKPCIWEGGVALITKLNYAYWTLLGFGVRGPGCGAPTKFINMNRLLSWMDEVVDRKPLGETGSGAAFMLRQLSPYKVTMQHAEAKLPPSYGQCDKFDRGNVLYKEVAEVAMTTDFAMGFYYAEIFQMAQFRCLTVKLDAASRAPAAIWLEHHCHRDVTGLSPGMTQPDTRKLECFVYYKSVAHLEFRFYFSFKATLEFMLYGYQEVPLTLPNPFRNVQPTDAWWPTDALLKWASFFPYYVWAYGL